MTLRGSPNNQIYTQAKLSRLKGLIQKIILAVYIYNVVVHISILVRLLLVEAASGSSDGNEGGI